jgi:hypothetical protein
MLNRKDSYHLNRRFVVARHTFGGIGDHISCLIGSWWLAKRTGRTLVIDWRGSRFNSDPLAHRNCFGDYYEIRDRLDGVEVIADDRVGELPYSSPIYPDKWTPASLATPAHLKHTAAEVDGINCLVNSGTDRPEPTIVINQWVDARPPKASVRALLNDLRPTESIRSEAQRFWDENIGPAPAVGIHVRHGNGENIGLRAAYWLGPLGLVRQLYLNVRHDIHRPGLSGRFMDNMPESLVGTEGQRRFERRLYRRIAKEFRALTEATGMTNARAFLFTDAPQVVKGLREFIPTLVASPKLLMPEGAGPLHQLDTSSIQKGEHGGITNKGINETITREMFIELDLLRRCNGLVCIDSGFSIFNRWLLDESRITYLRPSLINRLVIRVVSRLIRQ